MTSVFQLLGAPNQTYTRESMADVLAFKVKLANINWLNLTNKLLSDTNVTVSVSEPVRITSIDYLVKLNDLLAVYNSNYYGRKTLFNYLLWRMISAFVNDLSDDFRSLQNSLKLLISGSTLAKRNSKLCIAETDSVLGFALGALYVRENFPGKSKSVAKNMIENIRSAFVDNLYKLEWLDPVTRGHAVDKVNAMTSFIGYPDYILNADQLEQHYDNKFLFLENMKTLRDTPKVLWKMTPPTVNAYYSRLDNSIVFPAGVLQTPLFSKNYPKSVNYGGMGSTIAHEITHGFDSVGKQYDKYGSTRPWWKPETLSIFNNKSQCFVDQYNEYQFNGEQLKGLQTLAENIADNGGIRIAYYAFKKWKEENEEELPLPEIGLTHDQLFFLSFAQFYCDNISPEMRHYLITVDNHALNKFSMVNLELVEFDSPPLPRGHNIRRRIKPDILDRLAQTTAALSKLLARQQTLSEIKNSTNALSGDIGLPVWM
ncbi:hypothetical protein Btru_072783 [Bulinus truncatus]|nr:hypothetical protein Btru_072783 [Bulinus truncatus]